MTPTLIPFEMWHLLHFQDRDVTAPEAQIPQVGPAFTAIIEDRIIGCAGVNIGILPGIGIAWASFSHELMKDHPIWITRTCKRMLEDTKRSLNLSRIELVVNDRIVTSFKLRNMKWAEYLGFESAGHFIHFIYKT